MTLRLFSARQYLLQLAAHMVERLSIEDLARSLARSAWSLRHEVTPRALPPRITFALAFERNLGADEWQLDCDCYRAEIVKLRGELH